MRHAPYECIGGLKRQPAGYRFQTRRYEAFQVIYVAGGLLYFSAGADPQELGPGSVVLLPAGSQFALSCRGQGYQGVYFLASGELPPAFAGSAAAWASSPEVRALGHAMLRELRTPCPESRAVLEGLGRAMAWQAVREAAPVPDRPAEPAGEYWALSARQAMEATIHSGQSPRDVLASLPLSYRQISRYFRRQFGVSPKEHQLAARLAEAKRLLAGSDLSVTDVAIELGYSSSQHLANQFRQAVGLSPTQWRTRQRR